MKINNKIANHIANKDVTKHMERATAKTVWNDLRRDGWRAEGLTLVKMDGATEHHFVFVPHGGRVAVSHRQMEVAL